MQVISQSSRFQDDTSTSVAYKNPPNVESVPAVPTTWDTVYDPDHPDADWSGLVSKEVIFSKKHDLHHPSHREGIERTEFGIVSKQERQEIPKKRSNNDAATRNSGSLVIGGIDNPSDRFNTTYKRFENQERTDKDQLILEKRVHATRHCPDPANSNKSKHSSDTYHAVKQDSIQMNPASRDRHSKFNPRASLLSNLGDELIASNAIQARPNQIQSEYRSEKYRTLIGDNFKQFPGYTGHRR
jgi:hypothetical protein